MKRRIQEKLVNSRAGSSLHEYVLLMSMITLFMLPTVGTLGQNVSDSLYVDFSPSTTSASTTFNPQSVRPRYPQEPKFGGGSSSSTPVTGITEEKKEGEESTSSGARPSGVPGASTSAPREDGPSGNPVSDGRPTPIAATPK